MKIKNPDIQATNKTVDLKTENERLKLELSKYREKFEHFHQQIPFLKEMSLFGDRCSEGVSVWDKHFRLLFINPAVLKFFQIGETKENLIGRNMLEIFPQILSTPRYKIYQEVLRSGKSIAFNYYHYFPELNEGRYFAAEAYRVGENLLIMTRNVSRIAGLQDQLKQTEHQLLKTQNVAEVGYWYHDFTTKNWFWSDLTFELLGYDPQITEPSLEKILERIDFKERENAKKNFNNRDRESIYFQNIYKINVKNKTKYIRCKGEAQINDDGRINFKEGIFQDITLFIKAQQDLRISEERFRLIADNISEVFWLRTPKKILYVNLAFERIWQISREKIYRNPLSFFESVHTQDREKVKAFFYKNNNESTGNSDIEFRIILPDETYKWIWAKTFVVFDEHEKKKIIGFATDITEIKQKSKELMEAKHKAEESDHLKSAFLATMSHELRTPLNAVIGFSDLLSTALPSEEVNEYASTINKAGLQLLDIINNIFSVALLESKQISFKNMAFQLKELIEEIEPLVQSNAETCSKTNLDIRLVADTRHTDPSLYCDRKVLRQIWMILLSNALKFTEKGYIRYGYKILDEKRVKFFVKDSGIGIPLEKQKLIFKKFMQLEDTHTRKFGGTGLGLAIVKKVVELLKGELGVNSYPGKGSEFYFTLSCLHQSPEPAESLSFKTKVNWSKHKILIVEDNSQSTKLLRSYLQETGIQVIQTSRGEEVLDILACHPDIGVVLMDLNLPKMNGIETTRLLKPNYPQVPVIAHSAYLDPQRIQDIYESGCSDYLEKPYSKDELLHVLNIFLK